MEKSPLINKIERVLVPTAEGLGYELVRVLLVGSGKPTLQVMAERPDGTMGVEDCEKLSNAVSAILDVENLLDGAYYLEVSSPGIDRPLTRAKDFEKYKGFDARIEIEPGINGQKKFKGRLLGIENGTTVQIQDETGAVHALPFRDVERAKLLMTDELVASVMKKKAK
jgi:ribosome maturation factor RimP